MNKCKCRSLSPLAFGVSLGIVNGIFMMLFAWAGWLYAYGTNVIDLWATVYPGLGASLKGGLVGLAWGFLEGFVLGLLWAWIYNLCMCCCRSCCCTKMSDGECKK